MQDSAYGSITTTYENVAITKQVSSATSIEVQVRSYFKDTPILAEIARCESTFRHYDSDGSVLTGVVDARDTGVMQINTGFHQKRAHELGLDLTDFEDNMAYAKYLFEKEGTRPWKASSACWNTSRA